ncbi:MAG: BamA/TamA family outer membrane protein [Candidatus Poribacteria bacterium]|nr:BamA/TamA family outer membrane protein [Candidatus Poribacteria bacterium]
MKYAITKALILLLLFVTATVHSQSSNGTVIFDAPNVPSSEFQFDLDKRVISLVLEDPNAPIAPLFSTVDSLRLRNYRSRSVNFRELVQYYNETLKNRGWNALGKRFHADVEIGDLYLYSLQENEIIKGILVLVGSSDDVYLINIVGEIPEKRLGELLLNLDQLGIEIPELESVKPQYLELALPPPPSEITPLTPEPPVVTDVDEEGTPSLPRAPEPAKSWNWNFEGKKIHDVQLEGVNKIESANIMKVLAGGSGEIAAVMPILTKTLLNSSKKVSLRVKEVDAKQIAIFTIEDLPITQNISILQSLTISGSRGDQIQRFILDRSVPQDTDTMTPPTRFLAADAPIHEVRIRGNQKVPEIHIRQTLENGSEDLEKALSSLFKVMPYFEEVRLQVAEENSRYIATITVDEKPLSTDVYLGLSPTVRLGFNRVTGWEVGTGFEAGKRKDIGPLWLWNIRGSETDQTSKLFGKLSYAFGNPHYNYHLGGTTNWGTRYAWNLGLTAQIHRLTDVVAPEHFLDYNNGVSILQRVFGVPDFQNYYLRQGAEIALQWAPIMPNHWFRLAMVAESHTSLQKSTDWFIANLTSSLRVRGNPPITPGRMRGVTFQYDFHNWQNTLGWHNTLFVEHSNSAVGSDFDFTRMQLHFRYAFPLGYNQIRTRLLFGFSNATLPIQRQFVIGGMGGLRGYPWYRQENGSDGIITYKSGHTASPYPFTGDRGFLLNVEYHYRLSNLFNWNIAKALFAIVFLDEGQVWDVSGGAYTFDPKGSIGVGLQFGRDNSVPVGNINSNSLSFGADSFVFRVNIAKALEAGKDIQVTTAWYHTF